MESVPESSLKSTNERYEQVKKFKSVRKLFK